MSERLYVFQCPNCGSVYTSAVKPAGAPYQCLNDRTWLRLLFERAVETEEDRAIAARAPFWNGGVRPAARIWCDACPNIVAVDEGIDLGAGGKYCSEACANIGTERHRAALEQQAARLEQLYQEMPWLRPQMKESA